MMCWKPNKRRGFEVRSCYQVLTFASDRPPLGKAYGSLRSLLEVLFFVWITALGKILMIDTLQRRNVWNATMACQIILLCLLPLSLVHQ